MNSSTGPRHGCRGLMLLFALFACTTSGCLCAFHRDWKAASSCPAPTDYLAGKWEGTWLSHTNGHKGQIRAIFTDCGNGHYKAQYQGNFCVVLPFVYETTHRRTGVESGVTYFSAQEDLGPLVGGTFSMNGWANGQSFVANYRSDKDCGVFKMTRVGSCGCRADGCTATRCTATECPDTDSIAIKPYDEWE